MKVIDAQLEHAHAHCTRNEVELQLSQEAGCFYCLAIFPAATVTDFLQIERTAICPECMIDSVIGDASGLPITGEFLQRMHDYWFES
ncbi:MAG: cytoplasmic protein [Chloroflexota bacterium]|nr:cytoplasmic protein [Chloroflexota bacterium]